MNIINSTKAFLVNNRSGIAFGLGVTCTIASNVLAVKATPGAYEKIKKAEKEKGSKLNVFEVVKLCWKDYALAAATGLLGIGMVTTGKVMDMKQLADTTKRLATTTAAYELQDAFVNTYKKNVVAEIGAEKEKDIHEKTLKDQAAKIEGRGSEDVNLLDGDCFFEEPYFGKIFVSNKDKIERAVNKFNDSMLKGDGGEPVSTLLDYIYDETPISFNNSLRQGDLLGEMGFNANGGLLEVYFTKGDGVLTNGRMVPSYIMNYSGNGKYGTERMPRMYYDVCNC